MSGLVKGVKEYPSKGKQKLLDEGHKQYQWGKRFNEMWDKQIKNKSSKSIFLDEGKSKKSLGAGMLKEIKRKMMKHLPGRTKKTY